MGLITDVPGVRAGHWTGSGTGVTVVLFPDGSVGSAEVRGGAPATRETALLEPGIIFDGYRIVRQLHDSSRSHIYLAVDTEAEAGAPTVLKIPSIAPGPIFFV